MIAAPAMPPATQPSAGDSAATDASALYMRAVAAVQDSGKPSTSWLQRQMGVGYNTAAAWIEQMQQDGMISTPDHLGRRVMLGEGAPPPRPAPEQQMQIPVELPEKFRTADDRLRLLIERVERLEEEKKGINDDIREVFAEMKGTGYDTKIARMILRLRKMRPDDRAEMEALLDAYKAALGLS
ncbi:DUF2312 domain-containing protein [Altererythrobacter xixiisoli]|uniref:DUF2312 domain-containing protein n=2 Tax=Croceibacterium xixiisoli TaxID=1476466 RepID=A0A6I4TWR5_9SPHN|nr:DUF2312 domain-containing protein [Croceibacterium xixiisoli]